MEFCMATIIIKIMIYMSRNWRFFWYMLWIVFRYRFLWIFRRKTRRSLLRLYTNSIRPFHLAFRPSCLWYISEGHDEAKFKRWDFFFGRFSSDSFGRLWATANRLKPEDMYISWQSSFLVGRKASIHCLLPFQAWCERMKKLFLFSMHVTFGFRLGRQFAFRRLSGSLQSDFTENVLPFLHISLHTFDTSKMNANWSDGVCSHACFRAS